VPELLPLADAAWSRWRDGTALRVATTIADNKTWGVLPILADALEDAGGTNDEILGHLRSPHDRHGCWQSRRCFMLDHLLGRTQLLVARVNVEGWPPDREALVVNPGDWWGRHVYLVYGQTQFDPPLYAVEADAASDAEEIFVESEFGKDFRIDEDSPEAGDYGYHVTAGMYPSGPLAGYEGWVDLRGNRVTGELSEPSVTGDGTLYDGELIMIHDLLSCLYFGPGLSRAGVAPEIFGRPDECRYCGRTTYPGQLIITNGMYKQGVYCTSVCRDADSNCPVDDDPAGVECRPPQGGEHDP